MTDTPGWLQGSMRLFLILTLIALPIGACMVLPQMLRPRHYWEDRPKITMRMLAASQEGYYGQHLRYGTWREMVAADYIQQGYTRDNMIDNYSISVFNVGYRGSGTFTIVVVPDNPKNRKLREYAITEDQTVRMRPFDQGDNGVAPWNWEPLQ